MPDDTTPWWYWVLAFIALFVVGATLVLNLSAG
jgi:hypothetical protein